MGGYFRRIKIPITWSVIITISEAVRKTMDIHRDNEGFINSASTSYGSIDQLIEVFVCNGKISLNIHCPNSRASVSSTDKISMSLGDALQLKAALGKITKIADKILKQQVSIFYTFLSLIVHYTLAEKTTKFVMVSRPLREGSLVVRIVLRRM